ncbi:MAG: HD domain-containing phosphohydrolase [bacterium]|nr:HD domain-containing phosphohydrolase [bacterium]
MSEHRVLNSFESLLRDNVSQVKGVEFYYNIFESPYSKDFIGLGGEIPEVYSFDDKVAFIDALSGLIITFEGTDELVLKWINRHKGFVMLVLKITVSEYLRNVLDEFASKIIEVRDFQEIYNEIISYLSVITSSTLGAITVYDEVSNVLVGKGRGYKDVSLHGNVMLEGFFNVPLTPETAASKALEVKDILVINDAKNEPRILKKFVEYYKVDRVMIAPIFVEEKLFGMIYLGRYEGLPSYTQGEVRLLKSLIPYLTSVLKLLKHREDSEKRLKALLFVKDLAEDILSESSLLKIFDVSREYLKEIVKIENCAFYNFNPVDLTLLYNFGFSKVELAEIKKNISSSGTLEKGDEICPTFIRNPNLDYKILCAVPFSIENRNFIAVLGSRTKEKLTKEDQELIRVLFSSVKVASKNLFLYEKSVEALDKIIEILSQLESKKDYFTATHSKDVAEFALKVAEALNLPAEEKKNIYLAGLLHDIGKVVVEKAILLKDGPLNNVEWDEIRNHPIVGREILEHIPGLERPALYVGMHHEWYNGRGYPEGLKGEEIPLGARILCISDAVVTMLSDRPYRKALNKDQVVFELIKESGKQFDPELVKIVINILEQENL